MYTHLGTNYEFVPVPLPSVHIRCRDKNGKEDVVVFKDCSEEEIHTVLEICELTYIEWLKNR
jgi:hypothetical protein|tara:strand:+ start:116 stop:301 length:186 start_codon:yes stop_codon:yes gene_type:complete